MAAQRLLVVIALAALAAAPGCKLVKTASLQSAEAGAAGEGAGIEASVATMWDAQVIPHLETKASDLATLRPAIAAGLDAAGAAHGHRPASEDAPWNFPVRLSGTIVAANTESRAATADIDIDGDGTADATVQLGPVIRGTTLRDVLPFIDFTAYRDQIEFAQLSRALNTRAYEATLAELPRENLVGKRVGVLGAFTLKSAGEPILVTPAAMTPEASQ